MLARVLRVGSSRRVVARDVCEDPTELVLRCRSEIGVVMSARYAMGVSSDADIPKAFRRDPRGGLVASSHTHTRRHGQVLRTPLIGHPTPASAASTSPAVDTPSDACTERCGRFCRRMFRHYKWEAVESNQRMRYMGIRTVAGMASNTSTQPTPRSA